MRPPCASVEKGISEQNVRFCREISKHFRKGQSAVGEYIYKSKNAGLMKTASISIDIEVHLKCMLTDTGKTRKEISEEFVKGFSTWTFCTRMCRKSAFQVKVFTKVLNVRSLCEVYVEVAGVYIHPNACPLSPNDRQRRRSPRRFFYFFLFILVSWLCVYRGVSFLRRTSESLFYD